MQKATVASQRRDDNHPDTHLATCNGLVSRKKKSFCSGRDALPDDTGVRVEVMWAFMAYELRPTRREALPRPLRYASEGC
jgi:hypothetical protein